MDRGIYALLSASSLVGEDLLSYNLGEEVRSHHRLKISRSLPQVERGVGVVLFDLSFSSVCLARTRPWIFLLPSGPCGECSHLGWVCEIPDDLNELFSLTFS